MKKLVKVSALMVAGLAMFAFTTRLGSSAFEGLITYDVKVDSDNPQVQQYMQGMSWKTYIKGTKSRTVMDAGMYKTVTIADSKDPENNVALIDMMGNKYAVKADAKEKKAMEEMTPKIKEMNDTKTVAGYTCKHAQVTVKDKKTGEEYVSDVYYTDQLPVNGDSKYKGIKGFPLSFSVKQKTVTMTMTAKSVDKESVPDSLFTVPGGYKVMTAEEMQKDMMSHYGGGGQ